MLFDLEIVAVERLPIDKSRRGNRRLRSKLPLVALTDFLCWLHEKIGLETKLYYWVGFPVIKGRSGVVHGSSCHQRLLFVFLVALDLYIGKIECT